MKPPLLNCVLFWLLVATGSLTFPSRSAAITLGQVNDFQDGGTMGWRARSTVNVPNAGPLGVGDNALRVDSQNRMLVVNDSSLLPATWLGDYTAASVTAISMDVRNPNAFPLSMYIGVASSISTFGEGATYVTDYSIAVPPDDSWHNISFSILAADFIPSASNTEPIGAAMVLSNVNHLRILHSTTPGQFLGEVVAGEFYLDNITAAGDAPQSNADFDGDEDVDGHDLLIWQRGVGVGSMQPMGDADHNGAVDGLDLVVWREQFGTPPAVTAVPEPIALTVALLGGTAVLFRRRRPA